MLVVLSLGLVVNFAIAVSLSPPSIQAMLEDVNGDCLKDLKIVAVNLAGAGIQTNVSLGVLVDDPLIIRETDGYGSCVFYNLPAGTYFWRVSTGIPSKGNITIPLEEFRLDEDEAIAWLAVALDWMGEFRDGSRALFENMSRFVGFNLDENPFPSSEGTSLVDFSRDTFRWLENLEYYMAGLNHTELKLFHKMVFPFKSVTLGFFNDATNGVDFSAVANVTLQIMLDVSNSSVVYAFIDMYAGGTIAGYNEILRMPAAPSLGKTMEFPLQQIIAAFWHYDEPHLLDPDIFWDSRIRSTDGTVNQWICILDTTKSVLDFTITRLLPALRECLTFLLNRGVDMGVSGHALRIIGSLVNAVGFFLGVVIIALQVLHLAERYQSWNAFVFDLLQGDPELLAAVATVAFNVAFLVYLFVLGAPGGPVVQALIGAIGLIITLLTFRADYEGAITELRESLGDSITTLFIIRRFLRDMNASNIRHLATTLHKVASLMEQFADIADKHSSLQHMKQFFRTAHSNFTISTILHTELANAVSNATESLDLLLHNFLSWNGSQGQVCAHLEGYYSMKVNYTSPEERFINKAVIGTWNGSSYEYEKKTVYAENLEGVVSKTSEKEVARWERDLFHPLGHWVGWSFSPPCMHDLKGNKFAVFYNINTTSKSFKYKPKPGYLDYNNLQVVTKNGKLETLYHHKFYFDDGTTCYSFPDLRWGFPKKEVLDEWHADLNQMTNEVQADLNRVTSAIDDLNDFQQTRPNITDTQPPNTSLSFGEPKRVENGNVTIYSLTPIILTAIDQGDSGVALTGFEIHNDTFSTGWNLLTNPVSVNTQLYMPDFLTDGTYAISYNSTDNAGNVEPTKTHAYMFVVGGIIWENTTWTLENSPYTITDTMQIPENVTLTIEPGVIVTKPTAGDMFLLHGTIYAHGTVDNKIVFDGGGNSDFFVTEGPGGVNAFATLKYCAIRNGYKFWDRWGFFNITHSELANLTSQSYMNIQFSGGVYIEHSVFRNTGGFLVYVAPPSFGPLVYIRHNLFEHTTSPIESAGASELIVNYNSFIDVDGTILKLAPAWDDTVISATENYWGTLDTAVIDSMIYDKRDDITCAGFIDYLPILFEPHPDTPKVSNTIYVNDDNTAGPWDGTVEYPYQNITQGLSHALNNEIIFVYNGTYYENVVLNKTVCLIGESREGTVIDARGIGDVLRIDADNVTVSNFTICYGDCGVKLYSGRSVIRNNNITTNHYDGIWLTGQSVGNNIEDNIICNNHYGIDSDSGSKDNIMQKNIIINNGIGIYLRADDGNNTIQGNIIQNNTFGIDVGFSNDNKIMGNTITDDIEYGIHVESSVGNIVYDNLIANSGVAGIYFDGGNDNRIYHNTFIDNSDQVRISASFNFWHDGYPSGGNYWSDYTGADLYNGPFQNETGCDGIGDTPYVIDENNQDNYPLMKPYPDATPPIVTIVSPENKAYTTPSIPLTFTIDECTCWIGYSVDGELNVTSVGNTTLTSLLDGSHHVVVYANDTVGNMGASNTIYFTVDTTPPNITEISQIPLSNNVLPEDQTKVNATITDHLSGVRQAILNYTNGNGTWVTKNMTNLQGNVWNGTIPAFEYCTYVNYTIAAEDEVGNIITTEEVFGHQYQYHVIPEFPSFLILSLFTIATLLAVIFYRRENAGHG